MVGFPGGGGCRDWSPYYGVRCQVPSDVPRFEVLFSFQHAILSLVERRRGKVHVVGFYWLINELEIQVLVFFCIKGLQENLWLQI